MCATTLGRVLVVLGCPAAVQSACVRLPPLNVSEHALVSEKRRLGLYSTPKAGATVVAAPRSAVDIPSVGVRLVSLSVLSLRPSAVSAGGGAPSGAAPSGRWRNLSAAGSQKAATAHGATTSASRR